MAPHSASGSASDPCCRTCPMVLSHSAWDFRPLTDVCFRPLLALRRCATLNLESFSALVFFRMLARQIVVESSSWSG